ncbi:hypothetical protein B0H11DRAFT_2221255 [Mycena galericulata]|nr:hypothetical protein B0H11DRAFT_2221255 [Mycena galericulata]
MRSPVPWRFHPQFWPVHAPELEFFTLPGSWDRAGVDAVHDAQHESCPYLSTKGPSWLAPADILHHSDRTSVFRICLPLDPPPSTDCPPDLAVPPVISAVSWSTRIQPRTASGSPIPPVVPVVSRSLRIQPRATSGSLTPPALLPRPTALRTSRYLRSSPRCRDRPVYNPGLPPVVPVVSRSLCIQPWTTSAPDHLRFFDTSGPPAPLLPFPFRLLSTTVSETGPSGEAPRFLRSPQSWSSTPRGCGLLPYRLTSDTVALSQYIHAHFPSDSDSLPSSAFPLRPRIWSGLRSGHPIRSLPFFVLVTPGRLGCRVLGPANLRSIFRSPPPRDFGLPLALIRSGLRSGPVLDPITAEHGPVSSHLRPNTLPFLLPPLPGSVPLVGLPLLVT